MSQSILFLLLCGSISSASVNLLMRLSLSSQSKPHGMLLFYFLFGLLLSLWLGPGQNDFYGSWNPLAYQLGALEGFLTLLVTFLTAQALARGPAGLTIAFQNAGAVGSCYILWAIFGKNYGFQITWATILGSVLVIAGLVLGSSNKQETKQPVSLIWLLYAFSALVTQTVSLSLFHWISLLGKQDIPPHTLLAWYLPFEEQFWFIPGMFSCSLIIQFLLFLIQDRRALKKTEIFYGSFAGLLNGLSTFILLWISRHANAHEKLLVFPSFAVSVVLLCSLWERWLYRRPIHWTANLLCCSGIFIAAAF